MRPMQRAMLSCLIRISSMSICETLPATPHDEVAGGLKVLAVINKPSHELVAELWGTASDAGALQGAPQDAAGCLFKINEIDVALHGLLQFFSEPVLFSGGDRSIGRNPYVDVTFRGESAVDGRSE